jgi:hypothetical protein
MMEFLVIFKLLTYLNIENNTMNSTVRILKAAIGMMESSKS